MSWLVIGGALVVTGLLWWFFFGPKRAGQVSLEDGVQVVRVTVDGGYSPDVIEGVRFDEADLSGCDFTEATFSDCRLRGAKLLKTVFTRSDLRGADLGEIDDARLHAFAGATINRAQADAILAARGINVL